MRIKDLDENWHRRPSYGYNPDRDAEREWDAARRSEQDFKSRERNAGLEHEDDPAWQQAQRDKDRGPWFLKIDGKIYKQKGIPKSFDWKSGASKYGMAILKNRPDLQGKIFLTKKGEDDLAENATAGATSAGAIGTVINPHHSPGKARGKKSYLGSPGSGSGTKAPPQPKVVQPKNPNGTAKNGLDVKGTSLFGGPAKATSVIKRR